jgi:hypothetical protein
MKKQILTATALLLFCMMLFTGCLKDDCKRSYKIFTPVYKTLSQLRSEVKMTAPTALKGNFKLYIAGNRIYLSEQNKGIHIIDNSNPASPKNTAFLNIPGHSDVVVRGNMMYADLYCDLAALEVTGAQQVNVKKYVTNLFNYRVDGINATRTNPDSIQVQVDWKTKDTVLSCNEAANWRGCAGCDMLQSGALSGPQAFSLGKAAIGGTGGSMARFTAVNDYLYTVTASELLTVDLANAANPALVKKQTIGAGVETIFPFKDNLFLGSSAGMYIFNISNPVSPSLTSLRLHWRSCDPVITDGKYAYVTLFDAATCGGKINQLEIYNVTDLANPSLVKTYPLSNPHGLSKDGDLLFICDGKDGLKVFDARNVSSLAQVAHLKGMETYDVIALNGIAYVSAKGGLYQFDYSDVNNVRLLSKMDWKD